MRCVRPAIGSIERCRMALIVMSELGFFFLYPSVVDGIFCTVGVKASLPGD